MAQKDLKNSITVEVALATQTIATNTTTAGEIIDTLGCESITFVIQSGTITDGAYAALIQDGDDDALSDVAAVADTWLIGTEAAASFTASEDDTVKIIGYVGKKRYVRYNPVSTATSSGAILGATCIKGHAITQPTA